MDNNMMLILLVIGGIIAFFTFLYFVPVNLWITAIFSGVRVGLVELVFMRIRKVPPSLVVNALITATKAGLTIQDTEDSAARRKLKTSDLETHYLAGGNVPTVIKALISVPFGHAQVIEGSRLNSRPVVFFGHF